MLNLLHRREDCAGEWYPKRDQGQVYWICRACGIGYLNDQDVIRTVMQENRPQPSTQLCANLRHSGPWHSCPDKE